MASEISRDAIIYDGQCPFCIRQIDRIRRRDIENVFDYLPWQTPGLASRYPRLADHDLSTGMRLITKDGDCFVGADAVYRIARRIPAWRRWSILYRVPVLHRLARWAYAWIAAHRRTLGKSCENGKCRIDSTTP